jgi:thymidylate synthase (FAD)
MRIIEPRAVIETPIHGEYGQRMLELIERAARTCYKSEGKMGPGTAPDFVRKLTQVKKHESVIEHASATVRFIVDRGVSHELVRHRLAAYSQESTRYCNYGQEGFGKGITVIRPCWLDLDSQEGLIWQHHCQEVEHAYFHFLKRGWSPQQARSLLPNCLKTEVVMTCNMREWRHVFRMRTSPAAHPQMRQVMAPLLDLFKTHLPPLFEDISGGN